MRACLSIDTVFATSAHTPAEIFRVRAAVPEAGTMISNRRLSGTKKLRVARLLMRTKRMFHHPHRGCRVTLSASSALTAERVSKLKDVNLKPKLHSAKLSDTLVELLIE